MEMMDNGGDDAKVLFRGCLNFTWLQNKDSTLADIPEGTRCDHHVHEITKKCRGK